MCYCCSPLLECPKNVSFLKIGLICQRYLVINSTVISKWRFAQDTCHSWKFLVTIRIDILLCLCLLNVFRWIIYSCRQELARIDEQFQKERAEREKREEELNRLRKQEEEARRLSEEQQKIKVDYQESPPTMLKSAPPVVFPRPQVGVRLQSDWSSYVIVSQRGRSW